MTTTTNQLHNLIVLTGYTGVMCCSFDDFQADVERRLGRPVWTHEFGDAAFARQVRELYTEDFNAIMARQP